MHHSFVTMLPAQEEVREPCQGLTILPGFNICIVVRYMYNVDTADEYSKLQGKWLCYQLTVTAVFLTGLAGKVNVPAIPRAGWAMVTNDYCIFHVPLLKSSQKCSADKNFIENQNFSFHDQSNMHYRCPSAMTYSHDVSYAYL